MSRRRATVVDLTDYRPTVTQERFLDSTARVSGFFGGYGAGKTSCGAEKSLRLALANPGCAGIIVSPTWQMLERTTLPAFEAACPPALVRRKRISERRIDLVNGATVYYGSADKPGSLEGTNLAWAWLDEARLTTHDAWRILIGRVRDRRARALRAFVTTTPAMGWLADVFRAADVEAFHGSTLENAHNLAPGYIEQLRASYSARLARSLVDGEFSVLEGAVFEEFSEARHVVDFDVGRALREEAVRILVGADFGVQRPAIVVAGELVRPFGGLAVGDLVLVDELLPDQCPTDRWIPQLVALHDRLALAAWGFARPLAPAKILVDPAGNQRDQATGMPSVHLLQHQWGHATVGWETDPGWRLVSNGVALVQGLLAPADGSRPRLYVAKALAARPKREGAGERGVLRMLREYRYPVRRDGLPGDQPMKDGLLDHVADALRYLCLGVRREHQWQVRRDGPGATLATRANGPVLVRGGG